MFLFIISAIRLKLRNFNRIIYKTIRAVSRSLGRLRRFNIICIQQVNN